MNILRKRSSEGKENDIAICQLHGKFHQPWHYRQTEDHFKRRGYPVVTPDLHTDIPGRNFEEQTRTACLEMIESGYRKWVILAHSLSGNNALRIPDILEREASARDLGGFAVSQMIFVSAVVDERTITWLTEEELANRPTKNSLYYEAILRNRSSNNLQTLDPKTAREIFYSGLPRKEAKAAIKRLRPYWDDPNPPLIPRFPYEIPKTYYCCDLIDRSSGKDKHNDGVISWGYQNYTRETVLKIPPDDQWAKTFKNFGHMVMRLDPATYASEICKAIESQQGVLK